MISRCFALCSRKANHSVEGVITYSRFDPRSRGLDNLAVICKVSLQIRYVRCYTSAALGAAMVRGVMGKQIARSGTGGTVDAAPERVQLAMSIIINLDTGCTTSYHNSASNNYSPAKRRTTMYPVEPIKRKTSTHLVPVSRVEGRVPTSKKCHTV